MTYMKNLTNDVVIVGAGAAGMFASVILAQQGKRVLLLEKNDRNGKKLAITGKGRCNVTNACAADEVMKNIPENGRFLFSALNRFPPESVMAFFEENGCPLKIERGNRVFPMSDRSADVIAALERAMKKYHVERRKATVLGVLAQDGEVAAVKTNEGLISSKKVILATGGVSYPLTGSTGDGYRFAEELGHKISAPRGSLVPLVSEADCAEMQGLSLRNTQLRLVNAKGKTVFEDFGELLFTHFGLSGPVVLSASARMKDESGYRVVLDLKPALEEKQLDARILRDFGEQGNRDLGNALGGLLPRLMIPVVMRRMEVAPSRKVNSITREERLRLVSILKRFEIEVTGKRPVEEAVITAGGVSVREVDPKTMASKKARGLSFAGEVLDVDAYTGGFNLQIAWSTGRAAGMSLQD